MVRVMDREVGRDQLATEGYHRMAAGANSAGRRIVGLMVSTGRGENSEGWTGIGERDECEGRERRQLDSSHLGEEIS